MFFEIFLVFHGHRSERIERRRWLDRNLKVGTINLQETRWRSSRDWISNIKKQKKTDCIAEYTGLQPCIGKHHKVFKKKNKEMERENTFFCRHKYSHQDRVSVNAYLWVRQFSLRYSKQDLVAYHPNIVSIKILNDSQKNMNVKRWGI